MDLFELVTRVNFDSIWLILIRFEQILILSWLKLISNCNCRKFEFWHLFVCIFYLFGCCLFVYLFVFLLKLIKFFRRKLEFWHSMSSDVSRTSVGCFATFSSGLTEQWIMFCHLNHCLAVIIVIIIYIYDYNHYDYWLCFIVIIIVIPIQSSHMICCLPAAILHFNDRTSILIWPSAVPDWV